MAKRVPKEMEKTEIVSPNTPAPTAGTRQSEIDVMTTGDVSITKLVDYIIEQAYFMHASDVHVDPTETEIDIRFRIDGVLSTIFVLPKVLLNQVITTIKVHSGLRTDEHQTAQDGRFRVVIEKVPVDLRVSIIPAYHGENAVLRLLVSQIKALTLSELGLAERDKMLVEQYIRRPHGMILSTGPTGSGKTTTLYTLVQMLNTPNIAITTVEDPIEYSIGGITQIQTNAATGLTFAMGLRSILRQDPNIVMVGEIRDDETASIAVNAALTGHLLLSTLHTNDAATTLPRLLDMGIEPYLVASTVNIAIGQRLVRKLCPDCTVEYKMTEAEEKRLQAVISEKVWKSTKKFFMGKGCKACVNTGYRGRVGIYEVLEVRGEIRDLIVSKASSDAIRTAAIRLGMTTMLEDGFAKAGAGMTSVAEVLRVIQE
jgi:type II secretory ATPase GspE/PulE/Tfp pilus assembly ATPase PilB-like protein